MPEYLAPGVYIEEIEIGAKPIEGVSTSTAGFLGQTERGPTEVKLVTSFGQFQKLYGDFLKDSYMAFAVDGFFRNGGQRCFIGRVVKEGASKAELTTLHPITLTAIGEGEWGNRVAVRIENASMDTSMDPMTPKRSDLFKLTIAYWKKDPQFYASPLPVAKELLDSAEELEVYDDASTESTSPNYYLTKVNAASNLVRLESSGPTRPSNTGEFFEPLVGGSDGTDLTREKFAGDPAAPPGQRKGLTAFREVDEICIVYVPDFHCVTSGRETLIDDIVSHCENLKDRFAILDAAKPTNNISSLRPPKDSKYAAFYYPWIKVYDPLTKGPKDVPPGGYMAGIYARSDQERGVHKAPANEVIRGATDVEFKITKGEQDILNPRGVNCIRSFIGRGIRVWGARTTSSDSLWKYVNVRRLFIYVEESIEEGTQWVVFEPNDEKLWARVRQTISAFLTRVWRDGALMGSKPEEAFFVKCDRSTMTQDDIDNGRLICVIGIAPVKPAEFVIFRIAQWLGGSAVTE